MDFKPPLVFKLERLSIDNHFKNKLSESGKTSLYSVYPVLILSSYIHTNLATCDCTLAYITHCKRHSTMRITKQSYLKQWTFDPI